MKIFKISLIIIYLILLLGFSLHTSRNPQVFEKYTLVYFLSLVLLLLFFPFFVNIVSFCFSDSQIVLDSRKKIIITQKNKLLIISMILFITIISSELLLRISFNKNNNSINTIENFHPFLQSQLNKKDRIHVNSFGFRGKEISLNKEKNTYRIFILGGSTVLNREVSYEKNVSYLLETKLQNKYPNKKIEVLNAGKDFYTSEHSMIQYLFNISDFNPDLIIMWHGINDLFQSCSPKQFTFGDYKSDYSHFYGPVASMVFNHFNKNDLISIKLYSFSLVINVLKNNLFTDLTTKFSDDLYSYRYINNRKKVIEKAPLPSINEYQRNISNFLFFLSHKKIPVILSTQPYLYKRSHSEIELSKIIFPSYLCSDTKSVYSINLLRKGIEEINQITFNSAMKYRTYFVDLEKNIPKNLNYFLDDIHFTEKGNQKIADLLFQNIIENSIVR